MANGKKINIKINADSSNAEKGLNSVTSKINKLGKSLNKNEALGGFSKLGMAITGLMGPLGIVTKGLKVAVGTIKDLNDAALKQIKAEKQLEQSARNNPYLDKEAVQNLKEYASELQKVGSYGDEELIPMMARLASAGRDQSQIMDIMSAALDLSASGAMSMESAVDALNKSLNGNVTALAADCPKVKELTKEQLKNGEAIKLVADSYKGMSAEVTKATGAGNQLTMAWGDLKETMGMGWTRIISPIQRFFTWAINGVNTVAQKFNKILGITDVANIKPSDATKEQMDNLDVEIKANQEKLKIIEQQEQNSVKNITTSAYKLWEENEKKIAELQAKGRKERTAEESKVLREALNNRAQLTADKEDELYRGASAGSGSAYVDNTKEVAELQERIARDVEKRNQLEEVYNKQLEAESLLLETNAENEEEKLDDTLVNKWINARKTEIEQIKEELELLMERKDLLEGKGLDTANVQKAIDNCNKALKEVEFEAFMNKIQGVFDSIASVSSQLSSGIQKAVSLAQKSVDTTTDYQMAEVEKQYEQGVISAEEYAEKKADIEKAAAEKSYELNMYTWGAQLLEATAAGALATVKALSSTSNVYANIALAGLAASVAGVQIGALIAAKPVRPSFSTGGIVPGSSHIGGRDTTTANLSSREMVLNMAQQKHLFNIANGTAGAGGGVVVNMPIENTASDLVSVQKVQTNDGYKLLIQQVVNEALPKGVFNSGLKSAQSSFNGRNYTN